MKKYSFLPLCGLFLIIIGIFTFLQFSCQSPTAPNSGLSLSLTDVSCTEAWLNLGAGSLSLPANIVINKNGNNFLSFTLTQSDTTLYDGFLSPDQTYTYQAIYGNNKSETVTAKTLDTTSNNFSFSEYTLGDPGAGNSILRDVTIINDTLAYACGAIYVNDSTGQPDAQAYGLAKWNGETWSLKKLYYKDKDYQGNEFTSVLSNIRGIFVIKNNDIWLAAGSVFHWDGKDTIAEYSYHTLTPSGLLPGINKLWGTSSSNLFGVGNSGSIIHYSNGNWQKLESGTDVNLLDIFSSSDGENIWISGYQDNKPTVLLKYSNNQLTTVINDQSHLLSNYPGIISGGIESIWTNSPNNLFLLTWYGLYRVENKNFPNPKNLWNGDPNTWALIKVRGNNTNDIIAAGIDGRIYHYNGLHWKFYNELANNSDTYYSIAIKGNLCIAVGERYENGIVNYGLIQIGRR